MHRQFQQIWLTCWCVFHAVLFSAFSNATESPASAPVSASSLQSYREAITRIESHQGAYAADLPEALLGLGLSLQASGQHQEAVALFRRGVHLTRVNEGLYSDSQIPLLIAEIKSHIAGKNYVVADERQRYLYRVQTTSPAAGGNRTEALMQQAQWQYSAFVLDLEEENYTRLMNMWELYHGAYSETYEREGSTSPELLRPLRGMLQTLYLMSSYEFKQPDSMYSDDVMARLNQQRFNAHRTQNFARGERVIESIYLVESATSETNEATVAYQVMLGDWLLWHGEKRSALATYEKAARELEAPADAQEEEAGIPLSEPVPLPDLPELASLPPSASPEEADILLEFGVTAVGKVQNIERLDENTSFDRQASRLMRTLRKTRFRPRFEAGHAVDTQKIVRAFDIE